MWLNGIIEFALVSHPNRTKLFGTIFINSIETRERDILAEEEIKTDKSFYTKDQNQRQYPRPNFYIQALWKL